MEQQLQNIENHNSNLDSEPANGENTRQEGRSRALTETFKVRAWGLIVEGIVLSEENNFCENVDVKYRNFGLDFIYKSL